MYFRWTGLAYLYPRAFIDPKAAENLVLRQWSDSFEWVEDPINGYLDYGKPVSDTIEDRTGDCEDYAFVVASWAVANDIPVSVGFCLRRWIPDHVVAFTDQFVYSSGNIIDSSISEYSDEHGYSRILTKVV